MRRPTAPSCKRTCLIFLAAIACTSACRREEKIRAEPAAPNVLLISVDTLRADHVSCYGYERSTTPRIDRLAAEGALFEDVISSTSWTLPAHAAMFTGLADGVHGCVDTDKPLAPSRRTLAERLAERGYHTAGFFSGPYLHPVFGLDQGFHTYVDCTSYAEVNDARAASTGTIEGKDIWLLSHHDVTNPRVVEAVRQWLETRPAGPFFLFVHLWDVHFDFVPPPPYDTMFDPDYSGTITGEDFFFNPRVKRGMPRRDLEHLIALYDGEIAWTDAHVGEILDEFDARALTDGTVIVVTADHGTAFYEHGQRAHRNGLFDELIRVPLILRYPKAIPPGERYAVQARLIDVVPTLLDLLDTPQPADVMGQSLAPLFRGEPLRLDQPAVSELATLGVTMRSIRRPQHKMILSPSTGLGMVFDLVADPEEQRPLRGLSPVVEAASEDARWAAKWLEQYREAMPVRPTTSELPPEVLEKLKSLGYVGDGDP